MEENAELLYVLRCFLICRSRLDTFFLSIYFFLSIFSYLFFPIHFFLSIFPLSTAASRSLEPGEKCLHRRRLAVGLQRPERQQVVRNCKGAWDGVAAAGGGCLARLGVVKQALDLGFVKPLSGLDLADVHWLAKKGAKQEHKQPCAMRKSVCMYVIYAQAVRGRISLGCSPLMACALSPKTATAPSISSHVPPRPAGHGWLPTRRMFSRSQSMPSSSFISRRAHSSTLSAVCLCIICRCIGDRGEAGQGRRNSHARDGWPFTLPCSMKPAQHVHMGRVGYLISKARVQSADRMSVIATGSCDSSSSSSNNK